MEIEGSADHRKARRTVPCGLHDASDPLRLRVSPVVMVAVLATPRW